MHLQQGYILMRVDVRVEELRLKLIEIYELLEQIYAITVNQGTILLGSTSYLEMEALEVTELIKEMVDNKDRLIDQITQKEMAFDEAYIPFKGKITQPEDVNAFKEAVNKILLIKEAIVKAEKNNLLVMQNRSGQKPEKVQIKKQPQEIVGLYRQQQSKP